MHGDEIDEAYDKFKAYFLNLEIQRNIRNSKEEQFQEGFLRELFVNVLGYTIFPDPNYNLVTEQRNEKNSQKTDAAIWVSGGIIGVVELKDHKRRDMKSVEEQAFGYKNNNKGVAYVITSNFEKLRFYIENTIDFEEFDLFTLTRDEFAKLWVCLAYNNISRGIPKQVKEQSVSKEGDIQIIENKN